MEFRDGQHYDFVINNPAILTVEVGNNQPSPPSSILPNEQFVQPQELDQLMNQFSLEADGLKSKLPGAPFSSSSSSFSPVVPPFFGTVAQQSPTNMTMEDAEAEKQMWLDKLNQSFQLFLEYVQSQAQTYAKVWVKQEDQGSHNTLKSQLLELLNTSAFPANEWRRKLNEVQSFVKLSEVKDLEWQDKLQHDISMQPDTTVGSHVALALNDDLNQRKENLLQDIRSIHEAQQYQNNLLKTMTSAYVTFYSWILEQWNRSIKDINNTYIKVQQRIELLWSKDPIHQDISQLLQRYERFLQSHESHLPLEFTLSVHPRKEWKEYLAKQQPEECLRLMKNELHALEDTPALRKSIDVWKRELDRYDVTQLHKMNENRQRMKKRLEDAIEMETQQTCQRKWKELNERVYKIGTNVQMEANQKFKAYAYEYQQKQEDILRYNQTLHKQIQGYERRLALMDQPWANWMEKRKLAIKDWANQNYWQVSIASLLQVYDIVAEFRHYIETQQEAKLE